MIDAGLAMAVSRLRSTLSRSDETRTDAQLLAAFTRDRDADAFATLVYRHGPSVLGVCRRITGHDHDADDAFQAVFLVFARRAADVNPPGAVGSWLYGVAFRTAQDARVMAASRRARVTPTATLPDVPDDRGPETPDAELTAMLDAEIAQLPEHYRSVVVLCELNGVSRADAAKRLGIAEGTLSSRLAEARKRLGAGLKRKGFALSAALGAAMASSVSGSEFVFPAACRLGQLTAAGEPIPVGVSVTLADRVTRIMFLKKLTMLSVLTACGVLFLGAGWMTFGRAFADHKPAAKADGAKPAAIKPVNKLLLWRQGEAFLMDPDGKNEKRLFDLTQFQGIRHPVLSPDGKTVAYLSHSLDPKDAKPGEPQVHHVVIREVDGKDATELKVSGSMLAWSPDGKELLATYAPDGGEGPRDAIPKPTIAVIDVASKKDTMLALPDGHFALGFAPDGKRLLTMFADNTGKKIVMTACLVSRDGKEVTTLTDPAYAANMPHLSPDGKTVLFSGMKLPDTIPDKPLDGHAVRLYVQPIGGKVTEFPDVPQNAEIQDYCWSPDGKKIAYTWRQVHPEKAEEGKADERETESHLCVCDADGKNHKTLLTEKGMGQYRITLSSVDWR